MPNVNKSIVMGVLGRDPETKNFPNGGSVTNFSVATTDHWKDKTTGERKEATEWHRISTNGRLAEIASKYPKKSVKSSIFEPLFIGREIEPFLSFIGLFRKLKKLSDYMPF